MKKKGFMLVEMLIIIVLIAILAALLLPALAAVQEKAKQSKCRMNLKMIGTSFHMYVEEEGRGVNFPDANGGQFVARLFWTEILSEPEVYCCPSTPDYVTADSLKSCGMPGGLPDSGETNQLSYAGRKNKVQKQYPGMFKIHKDTALTSLGSDDWQATNNHENGGILIVLYADGHVDTCRERRAAGQPDFGYAVFRDDPFYDRIAHPLTN